MIRNIGQLLTVENGLGLRERVSILIEGEKISGIGRLRPRPGALVIDAEGGVVMPGLVDAHTHLVFAGSRADEMAQRLGGASYEEIARWGGGIRRTVAAVRAASEDELYEAAQTRIASLVTTGTTTVEIKSGYGLSWQNELKMLKVIKRLRETTLIDIVPTFLGAHAFPPGRSRREYVEEIIGEMLPTVAAQNLADFCDVFMEGMAFNRRETEAIFKAAQRHGLKLKIHADELSNCGGAAVAGKFHATSADHLIHTGKDGIRRLKKGKVVPVLLPGTALFLQIKKRPDVKTMMRLKLPIALASDFNPGTCMITSLFIILALGCLVYGLPVERAIAGVTINAARALGLGERIGSLKPGKQADLLLLRLKSYEEIPYYFGQPFVKTVIKRGVIVYEQDR